MTDIPHIDVPRLLAAIRTVETADCPTGLRFEAAYMPHGYRFALQGWCVVGTGRALSSVAERRWVLWGAWSAASYGPWQILYHTAADLGYEGHPCDLLRVDVCQPWVERLLHRIARRGACTIEQIADAWNSGTHRDAIVPEEYIRSVVAAYAAAE